MQLKANQFSNLKRPVLWPGRRQLTTSKHVRCTMYTLEKFT